MSIKDRAQKVFDNATQLTASSTKALKQFNENFDEFGRDIKLVISNISSSFKLIGTDSSVFSNSNSELNKNSYNSISDVLSTVRDAVVPNFSKDPTTPYNEELIVGDKPEPENERWFFVNGIATSKEVAKINGQALSDAFDVPIHLLYNPSQSVPIDLYESIKERTFNQSTAITDSIYEEVKSTLKEGLNVKLMGHSQGGIITSSVINRLVEDDEMKPYLDNIELYTFASAADEVKQHPELSEKMGHAVPYNEHFVNEGDLVARIGKGADAIQEHVSGKIFTYEKGDGHLLNGNYLQPFLEGKYDPNNESRLSQYYNTNKDLDNEPVVKKTNDKRPKIG